MSEIDLSDNSLSCRVNQHRLRLERLRERAAGLAGMIDEAARQFAEFGVPFHAELLADLQEYGREFQAVRNGLEEATRDADVEGPLAENVASLAALEERVQALRALLDRQERGRKRQENAHAALMRLMSLIRKDGGDFHLLGHFKERVGALVARFAVTGRASDEESEEILNLAAPYEALDRLVCERDVISLEAEFDLGRAAEAAVEREIVYAVARGYLVLGVGSVEPSVPDAGGAGDTLNLSGPAPAAVGKGLAESSLTAVAVETFEIAPQEPGGRVDQPAEDRHAEEHHGASAEALKPESFLSSQTLAREEEPAPAPAMAPADSRSEGEEGTGTQSWEENEASPPPAPFEEGLVAPAPIEPKTPSAFPTAELRAEANVSTRDAATAVRSADAEGRAAAINDLAWCLMRDGRLGLAYNLSRHLEENGLTAEAPAALIEALALSSLVRSSSSEVAGRLRDNFHELLGAIAALDAQKIPLALPLELCAFAACLRPALLAPTTGAPELLRQLHLESTPEELRRLRDLVLGPSSRNLVLTHAQLQGDFAEARWSQALEALQARCVEWLSSNRVSQVIFHATTEVWHRWLRENGPIGGLIERVIRNQAEATSVPEIREELDRWSDKAFVDRQLHRTDEELRQIGAKRRPISARAVTAVRNRCAEAVVLVGEWLDLLESRPVDRDDWIAERVREYRRDLLTAVPLARNAIASGPAARQTPLRLPLTAADQAVLRSLDDLLKLFRLEDGETGRVTAAKHRLHGDLLRITDIELDEHWEPENPEDEALLRGIVNLVGSGERSWNEVIASCWVRNDFLISERVLELLEQEENSSAADPVADLQQENTRRLQEARLNVRDSQALIGREIDKARLKGLIDEDERLDLTVRLTAIDGDHSLRLGRDRAEMMSIHEEFTRLKRQHITALEARLSSQAIAAEHPGAYERILRVLESEDLVTAHEYLAIIERGGELPTTDQYAPGFDFFGVPVEAESADFYSQIEPLFFGSSRASLRDIARRIQTRQSVGPFDMSARLTPGQAQQASEILDEWSRLRNRVGEERESIKKILTFVGFILRELHEKRDSSQGGRWFEFEAEPLESRNDCILPDFGSRSQGRYHVICLEGQPLPLEEEILRATSFVKRTQQPVIAFFFGPMSSRRRRDLAHALRARPRKLLVLDEILLVYLCLQKRRLPSFFNAASALSVAEPFTTIAAQVDPEMFFGRAREIESVFSTTGTNLVYGGRQLGKTALLNEVRRRFHRPPETIVDLIDMRYGESLGLTRPIEDIWLVIAGRLQPYGILQPNTRRGQTIGEEVARWLDQDRDRRIVLLLDEADTFLNIDGAERWPRVGQLKNIMERTQRRFKVVFAGLHNVQRTSHDVNTPLAHMGNPICVGPFLSNEEMRDAADMVGLPFGAMGYRFQAPDLVGQILAQSNYYPSLIQIGCQQLLKRLSGKDHSFEPTKTPPYEITLRDIEDAYADTEVRRQIRDRFRWTLELDNRYRVIALCLALETLDKPSTAAQGYTLQEIREWAVSSWPKGFSESTSNDKFRSLLEEMCELGVLRAGAEGRFVMRSPNVIRLIGTEYDILATLDDAAREDPKPEERINTRSSFRRVYHQHTKWRRSPLTSEQESRLRLMSTHGLYVLFGTEAAGLNEVRPFLDMLAHNAAAEGLALTQIDDLLDSAQFQKRIEQVLDEREEGTTLAVIHPQCPWSEQWVARTGEMIARRRAEKRKFIKFLFLGGSREAWIWSELPDAARGRLEAQGLVEMTLEPWNDSAVRQWKKEAEFGENNDEDSRRFLEATGNWCMFLHEVGQRCVERSHYWKDVVAEYQNEVRNDPPSALRRFGLVPEAEQVLQVMAEYGGTASVEDFMGLLEQDASHEFIERVLRWADLLQLVHPAGEQKWTLDHFLSDLMTSGPRDAKR